MTIKKNVKKTLILSVYSQDICGVIIALNKLAKKRQTVFVTVDVYTNMFKNQGDKEDAFLFFDITDEQSCITIDNYEREITIYFSKEEIERIVKEITEVLKHGIQPYMGITKTNIDKKSYALVLCNVHSKSVCDFNDGKVKEMLKSESKRLLEEEV